MLVVRTSEDSAYPIRKLISSQKTVGFYNLALSVNPLRLDGVKPRTLLRKKATHNPHPASLSLTSRLCLPSQRLSSLSGDMPARVVPDEHHDLLADLFELLQAPLKELGRYGTDGPSVNQAQPRIADLRQVEIP